MESKTGILISGLIFGSGLTLSGVANPQAIRDQLKLTDFHMLITFLTASASSAAIIGAYNSRSSHKALAPKTHSSYGWIGKYDGNVIGGALIGLGMSLTGACPGTVLVQAVGGIGKSRFLVISSLFAGLVYSRWRKSFVRLPTGSPADGTVMTVMGWSTSKTIVVYEASMLVAIAMALQFAPRSVSLYHPVIGGLLIGLGQLSSVILAKRTVGVSVAYEDMGRMIDDALTGRKSSGVTDSVVFAAGLMAGAGLTMLRVPAILEVLAAGDESSLLSVLVGGFVLVFGARIAGGCTSGHGISGMAGMGLSSFITVASMFAMGILTSYLTG